MRRVITLVAINVVVCCVLAESAALCLYYVDTGGVFYTHRKPNQRMQETTQRKLTGEGLHPYFGRTHTRYTWIIAATTHWWATRLADFMAAPIVNSLKGPS